MTAVTEQGTPAPATRSAVVLVAVAAIVALAFLASCASAAPVEGRGSSARETDVSANWGGYVVTGPGSTSTMASPSMTYTDVTGQWVEPKAVCTPGSPTSVAVWVGLGGYSVSSRELEQAGTAADCSVSGKPSYYIWYELVPSDSVNVKTFKISPGDVIASVVEVDGTNVLVQLIDRSRGGKRFTKHLTMSSPDQSSAEWIVEAPSQCGTSGVCRPIPLTDFDSIDFSRSYATGNGLGGTISSPDWMTTELQLVPSGRVFGSRSAAAGNGVAGAIPSALASDGKSFDVTWQAHPSVEAG